MNNQFIKKFHYVFIDLLYKMLLRLLCPPATAANSFLIIDFLCRYDILVGRSPRMGNATRLSFQSHISLVDDLKPGVDMLRPLTMSIGCYIKHLLDFTV